MPELEDAEVAGRENYCELERIEIEIEIGQLTNRSVDRRGNHMGTAQCHTDLGVEVRHFVEHHPLIGGVALFADEQHCARQEILKRMNHADGTYVSLLRAHRPTPFTSEPSPSVGFTRLPVSCPAASPPFSASHDTTRRADQSDEYESDWNRNRTAVCPS